MQAAELNLAQHTVYLAGETDFDGWRSAARRLALAGVEPSDVGWVIGNDGAPPPLTSSHEGEGELPAAKSTSHLWEEVRGGGAPTEPAHSGRTALIVPREFVERAETVICHSDPERFALLYRLLWRLREEPKLLEIASDPDVRRFEAMEKAVRRDIHKMRAFVRFRRIGEGGSERFVAWFEPSHYIAERNAPFFVRRFTGMRWAILTPHASVSWDGENLAIGPGASKANAPAEDATEGLWQTYFENIFNPARLKVQAMQREMPKKYWRNLPEASLIPGMIAGADKAAKDMIEKMPTAPAPHHAKVQARHWPKPDEPTRQDDGNYASIAEAREAAKGCRRCPLWRDATQTVFGEGPDTASVVFVGEQPGDQEDLAGKPFVGPAGKVFDNALDEAGVARQKTYVTNAVKHFKFEPRGKRRIHSKPNAGELQACSWWVDHELALIKPDLAVALGATAAQSLLGKAVAITRMRGQVVEREDGLRVFLTVHPSFILRIPDPRDKEAEYRRFVEDLRAVGTLMG